MSEVVVRSFLLARDQAAFDQATSHLVTTAQSLRSNPDVAAYAVLTPNPDQSGAIPTNDDPLTILVYERYANEAARCRVNALPHLNLTDKNESLFTTQDITINQASSTFQRLDYLKDTPDPYVVTASFLYQKDKAAEALTGWRDLVAHVERTEPETYLYSVFKLLDRVSTFEVYRDQGYVRDVHLKSGAIAVNNAQNGAWRVPGQTFATKWVVRGGFLAR